MPPRLGDWVVRDDMMCLYQILAEVNVLIFSTEAPFQSSVLPLCSDLWHLGRSRLVGLKGAVGCSHVLSLLLMPHPHFSEDAGDAAGHTSCQW